MAVRIKDALATMRLGLNQLEAALGDRRPIDLGILDELAAGQELTMKCLGRRLRRRQSDVRAVLRLLEAQGQIKRVGRGGWTLAR